jgi:hypothetical protein
MGIESRDWLVLAARAGKVVLTTLPPDAQVLFNIGGPALNQLNDTAQKNKLQAKRSVAAGLGLTAASLLAAQSADAAEIAQVIYITAAGPVFVCLCAVKTGMASCLQLSLILFCGRSGRGW